MIYCFINTFERNLFSIQSRQTDPKSSVGSRLQSRQTFQQEKEDFRINLKGDGRICKRAFRVPLRLLLQRLPMNFSPGPNPHVDGDRIA